MSSVIIGDLYSGYKETDLATASADVICKYVLDLFNMTRMAVIKFKSEEYEWHVSTDILNKLNDSYLSKNVVNYTGYRQYRNTKILGVDAKLYYTRTGLIELKKKVVKECELDAMIYGVKLNRIVADCRRRDKEKENKKEVLNAMYGLRSNTIEKVIFNDPATIIIWKDGSKTIVKCGEGDVYDPEKGFAMAITKKFFGNKGNYFNEVKKWLPEKKEEPKSTLQEMVDNLKSLANRQKELTKALNKEDVTNHLKSGKGYFITVKEFCVLNKCDRRAVYKRIKDGELEAVKQSGSWLIKVYK